MPRRSRHLILATAAAALTAVSCTGAPNGDATALVTATTSASSTIEPLANEGGAEPPTLAPPGTSTTSRDATADVLEPPSECQQLTAFDTEAGQDAWRSVNDDVMGGRSSGGVRFDGTRLVFEGEINTDGGGFASLRLPLAVGTMEGATSIVLRAVFDERSYMLTLEDQLDGRDRRVSHQATIDPSATVSETTFPPGAARTVTIPVQAFAPTIFGQPVDDLAVQPVLVDQIGLMISDGLDGPFLFQLEWIAHCP